jgi:hypothetical protein
MVPKSETPAGLDLTKFPTPCIHAEYPEAAMVKYNGVAYTIITDGLTISKATRAPKYDLIVRYLNDLNAGQHAMFKAILALHLGQQVILNNGRQDEYTLMEIGADRFRLGGIRGDFYWEYSHISMLAVYQEFLQINYDL